MIKIDWKKGELTLSGKENGNKTILMEFALIASHLAKLLVKDGFNMDAAQKILLSQVYTGVDMAKEEEQDYITEEIYERGES